MRRPLAAVVLGLALLTASCSNDKPETPAASGSPSVSAEASTGTQTPAPGGSVAVGTAEVKAVCDKLKKTMNTWVQDFVVTASGIPKIKNDRAKVDAAVKKMKDASVAAAAQVRAEGAKANNAELVKATAVWADALLKLNEKVTAEAAIKDPTAFMMLMDSQEVKDSADTIAKVCGI